jgi:hypothetical protein
MILIRFLNLDLACLIRHGIIEGEFNHISAHMNSFVPLFVNTSVDFIVAYVSTIIGLIKALVELAHRVVRNPYRNSRW